MTPPLYARPFWELGLDLGQRQDYTALVTLEVLWTFTGRDPVTFENGCHATVNLCGLRRFPLGTSYADYPEIVARRLSRIYAHAPLASVSLTVDAGGPGGPVIDELRRTGLGIPITPLFVTNGAAPGFAANGHKTVPRRELIANMLLMIDHQLLRWPARLPERAAFEYELLQLNAGTTHPEEATAHDDIVMAVAIAAWQAKCRSPQILPLPKAPSSPRWTPHGPLF